MPRKIEKFHYDPNLPPPGELFNNNFAYIKEAISKLDEVNYSYNDIAKIFQVTKVSVHRWLNVDKIPNTSNLKKICQFK